MRISINDQATDFLKLCKKNDTWVFNVWDIKKTIKDYLVNLDMLFSPYDKIYVIKKTVETKNQAINKNIYYILEKMWGILSWEFALNHYLWKKKIVKEYLIYKWMKNFSSYIGKDKKIKVIFKPLVKQRKVNEVKFGNAILKIESPLSFIVNNMKKLEDNTNFKELLNTVNFTDMDILNWLLLRYKISWLSRLAIYMKNIWKERQYNIIKKAFEKAEKKIDRRWNKVNIVINKEVKKPKKQKVSLDELI